MGGLSTLAKPKPMTGAERSQAAKAMAKAKIVEVIPANASVQDVLEIIKRKFVKNQTKANGRE